MMRRRKEISGEACIDSTEHLSMRIINILPRVLPSVRPAVQHSPFSSLCFWLFLSLHYWLAFSSCNSQHTLCALLSSFLWFYSLDTLACLLFTTVGGLPLCVPTMLMKSLAGGLHSHGRMTTIKEGLHVKVSVFLFELWATDSNCSSIIYPPTL